MTNQYNCDDILYCSKGSPITELRKVGQELILFTENQAVLQKFKEWRQCLFCRDYIASDRKGKEHLVGVDLHFDITSKKQLIRALTINQPVPS